MGSAAATPVESEGGQDRPETSAPHSRAAQDEYTSRSAVAHEALRPERRGDPLNGPLETMFGSGPACCRAATASDFGMTHGGRNQNGLMGDELEKLMRNDMERYPRELVARFPRIADRIVSLWDTPEAMRRCFEELLITDQDRQGFPPEIASELFSLSRAYEDLLDRTDDNLDPWALDVGQAKGQLEEQGIRIGPGSLFDAAEQGHAREVLLLLQAGVSPNVRDRREWTPLMVAAFEGSEEAALMLLEFGADIHAENRRGYGPLHWAAFNGYDRVVSVLLDRGANVNALSLRRWSPLLQAAAKGHEETVRLLLEHGGDPNLETDEGWTPLHKAISNGHQAVVLRLLEKGANLLAAHQDGTTALDLAQRSQDPEVMAVIRKWASDQRARAASSQPG